MYCTWKDIMQNTSINKNVSVLTDIYQEKINIAIWQSQLSNEVVNDVKSIMQDPRTFRVITTSQPDEVVNYLTENESVLSDKKAFCDHIALLTDMFSTLFETKRVGLRLTMLDRAMCPKFHVDRVPCRLVSTFAGVATEWLPHHKVDRSKLGAGSLGVEDELSGIMSSINDIQQMSAGDVALLKGEGWYNNENAGAVHRSPALANNSRRLLLTLDVMD